MLGLSDPNLQNLNVPAS
uniref:Uncharacterized protein n=1 Tax=Anguilla anguilla TaxID=7936 RepID=A0A0E9VSA6_ANGAN